MSSVCVAPWHCRQRLADQLRSVVVSLVERVEDGAQLRVGDGHLDVVAGVAVAHVNVVVEVDRSRGARRDAIALHAGLREDEHLRFRRDFKSFQERSQVSQSRLAGKFDLAAVEGRLQARDAVVRRRLTVFDRRLLVFVSAARGVRARGHDDQGGADDSNHCGSQGRRHDVDAAASSFSRSIEAKTSSSSSLNKSPVSRSVTEPLRWGKRRTKRPKLKPS